jgi:hypothetical protein
MIIIIACIFIPFLLFTNTSFLIYFPQKCPFFNFAKGGSPKEEALTAAILHIFPRNTPRRNVGFQLFLVQVFFVRIEFTKPSQYPDYSFKLRKIAEFCYRYVHLKCALAQLSCSSFNKTLIKVI